MWLKEQADRADREQKRTIIKKTEKTVEEVVSSTTVLCTVL